MCFHGGAAAAGKAQGTIIMRAEARWTYLEVAAGPVGDKVQLILQAAHISQVVKGSALHIHIHIHWATLTSLVSYHK